MGWGAIAAVLLAGPGRAAEVAPFRLTSVTGFAELRSLTETDRSRLSGAGAAAARRSVALEEEVGVATRSYFYHPNLAQLELGAGLTLAQEQARGPGNDEGGAGAFTRLSARLSLLEANAFPSALYYVRSTPPVALAVAERFRVTDTRYGASAAVRALSPLAVEVQAYRHTQEGSGARHVTDETVDHLGVVVHAPLHSLANLRASLTREERHSASGATDLPIRRTDRTVQVAELASSHRLGASRPVRLQNRVAGTWESGEPERRELRVSSSGFGQLAERLQGFGRFQWRDVTTDGDETANRGLRLGLSHQLYESLFSRLEGRVEESEVPGLSADERGIEGDLAYRKRLPVGRLEVTYRGDYSRGEQRSTAPLVRVVGEEVTLPGFDPVRLAREGAELGSVRVFNATRSQAFAEGIDYRAFALGAVVSLQRLAGSRIAAGEAVLVDYAYAPAGSFGYGAVDQTLGLSWSYQGLVTAYARYRDLDRRRRSGEPLRALNSAEVATAGFCVRAPLGEGAWGVEVEGEDRDEELSPARRQAYGAYLEGRGAWEHAWRLGLRRTLVDYGASAEDTDLWGATARLDARPWPRVVLGAEAGYEDDRGPTLGRRAWFARLRGEWGLGQLRAGAEGSWRAEAQGPAERRLLAASAYLRREF